MFGIFAESHKLSFCRGCLKSAVIANTNLIEVVGGKDSQLPSSGVLVHMPRQLRAIVNRLHHLANLIYDNVRPFNDDEMATLFRNYLLAVSRKRQKVSLEFDVFRTTHHVCADIHEWLIAQCLSVLFGDCLGLRSALHRNFVVRLKSHLISSLRDSPKMKLTVALG